jgi:hypothetical protein
LLVVFIDGGENLCGIAPEFLDVGPSENIVKKINLSSILCIVSVDETIRRSVLTNAHESAAGQCVLDIVVLVGVK